jgi:hypothetical protein
MLLQHDDFREVFGAGGEHFERLMKDLVRSETRRLGLAENDVHWDQRTNVADGGCDIWVTKGNADTTSFLPITPSSISLKSGEDGTKPATFASEVRDHPTLIGRLKAGNSFLWCCPRLISQPARNDFFAKAKELATELECDEKQFSFFWVDAISERVERSPYLIAEHLPTAWKRLEGLSLVKNWQPDDREPVRNVTTWVNFDERDAVKQVIKQHLCGTDKNRLLHVAGLSGSGKTRTVVQACKDEPALAEVIYCPALSEPVDHLLTHLNAKSGNALLIIDELPLDDYDILARRIERMPATVRVVSIGPGRANERQREGILILAPPTTVENIANVARGAAGALGDDVIQSIANFAGKDLRLALLLVEATLKTQAPQFVPLRDNHDVWTRIRALFAPHITCPNFDHHYGLLTTIIDVGVRGKSREELAYIAKHFEAPIGQMDACVENAVRAGLGSRPFDHFEATPRALARSMFFYEVWPSIQHGIDQFLTNCPSDRLRKRFLERCQELPDRDRQEVMAVVSGFFLKHFGEPNLARLNNGKESKLFQTWAETDPEIGLSWLGHATLASGPADFARFNGENNYSGGWNGRRQVVWLCEHLSCFKEYFNQAEGVLFRLSHVETEKSIGNNGTNIWKALFHPWVSYTEVPFDDRLALLIGRLRNSEGRSLELVVAAALTMLGDGGIRAIPPAVVGGRVRPTEWKPRARGELLDCMQKGGRQFLNTSASLAKDRQLSVLDAIVPKIGRFFDLGLFDEIQNWVTAVDPAEDIARKIRKEVDSWLSWRLSHTTGNDKLVALVDLVQRWRDSIEPRSLIDRVKDLTSRDYWEHLREVSRSGKEISHQDAARETDALYRSVAEELLKDVHTFAELGDWLASSSSKSGDALAQAIALLDGEGTTHAIIGQWIAAGKALPTCAGYLRGFGPEQRRAETIDASLVRLADTQPGAALRVTADGDFSEVGFDRIIRCLKKCNAEDLWGLRPLVSYSWREILTEERVLGLAQELHRLQQLEGYREVASSVAVDILHLIYSENSVRDPTLAAVVLHILADANDISQRNGWDWVKLAKAVESHDPKAICRLAVSQLVKSRSGLDDSLNKFVAECAHTQPDEAMAVIGDVFAHKESRWVFRALVFRSLFDSIGVRAVSQYLEAHQDHAPFIARHIDGPSIDKGGNLQIPELADWMISRFGENTEVWDEFMMGRHSFEVFGVPEGYEAAKDIATRFQEYPKAWVRKWAAAEIADMDRQIQAHQREEDLRERE